MRELRARLCRLGLALVALALAAPLPSALAATPRIVDVGPDFYPREVNDHGTIVGYHDVGFLLQNAATWKEGSGIQELGKLPHHKNSDAFDINNAGVAVGETEFNAVQGEHGEYSRATRWSGGGGAQDLGAIDTPSGKGFSSARTVSAGGVPGGNSTRCDGCSSAAAMGAPFAVYGPNPPVQNSGGIVEDIGPGGVIGEYLGDVKFNGGGEPTQLGFNARRILDDGRIVGDRTGNQGTVVRSPGGTVTGIPCGGTALDANNALDILAYSGFSLVIWHRGECFEVDELLPDGVTGYSFPSQGASAAIPAINEHGQIATRAYKTGEPGQITVLLTPQYPLEVRLEEVAGTKPGEYEFEAVVDRGEGTGVTTTWDYGDGTTATGRKVKKQFTKPGTFTVTGTVTREEDGLQRTVSKTVVVPAPTLQLGISLPQHEQGPLPFGATIDVVVNVGASADGVGDLSELTFQRGTFTVAPAGRLEFTTASTSPFSLSPGSGNVHPLGVRTVGAGPLTLDSLITGVDAAGRPVSAHVTRDAEIAAPPGGGGDGGGGGNDPPPPVVPGAPAPPAPPAVVPVDETGPQISLPKSNRRIVATRSGAVRFKIGPAGEDTTGVLLLKTAGRIRTAKGGKRKVVALGTKSFQALNGQTVGVTIKLSSKLVKYLRSRRRLRTQANVTLRDAKGNATIRSYSFTIAAPRRQRVSPAAAAG